MPVIDTSYLIDLQRAPKRYARVAERLAEEGQLVLPAAAALEYLWGLRTPAAALDELSASFSIVGFDETLLLSAVALFAHEPTRPAVGGSDLQIAAAARRLGTYVVTANPKDFRALGVPVWDYRHDDEPPARQAPR